MFICSCSSAAIRKFVSKFLEFQDSSDFRALAQNGLRILIRSTSKLSTGTRVPFTIGCTRVLNLKVNGVYQYNILNLGGLSQARMSGVDAHLDHHKATLVAIHVVDIVLSQLLELSWCQGLNLSLLTIPKVELQHREC